MVTISIELFSNLRKIQIHFWLETKIEHISDEWLGLTVYRNFGHDRLRCSFRLPTFQYIIILLYRVRIKSKLFHQFYIRILTFLLISRCQLPKCSLCERVDSRMQFIEYSKSFIFNLPKDNLLSWQGYFITLSINTMDDWPIFHTYKHMKWKVTCPYLTINQ